MFSMDVTGPEEVIYKDRQLWRIGSLIEMLKSDEAPAILGIHYESWPAFEKELKEFAVRWYAHNVKQIEREPGYLQELCSALSDFLRSVIEGAEKPDGIPGFFGYELVEHEDGWIEVTEGVYHIWALGGGQRLWVKPEDGTSGAPVVENAPGAVLRLTLPYAIWKGQSFKVEAI